MSEFQHQHAIREASQILISLTGPSGGGKTLSALRLAHGMVSVFGGKIFVIDTDGGKSLEYAPPAGEAANPKKFIFDFECVELSGLYNSLRFRDAIMYCAKNNAGVIIVDNMSDEHDGEGGYLEFGESEISRVGKAYGACWRAPKVDRKKLIRSFAQSRANLILCFRAEEKLDWSDKVKPLAAEKNNQGSKKGEPRPMGWMPVGAQDFLKEMNAGLVLQPAAEGRFVADRSLLTEDQKMVFKVREYFKPLLSKESQIDEELGRKMALWATGGKELGEDQIQRRADRAENITMPSASVHVAETGPDHSEPCPLCKNNPPSCATCGLVLLWRAERFDNRYGILKAVWRCPKNCKPPKGTTTKRTTNVDALDWHAILEGDQKPKDGAALFQEEPGAAG